MKRWFLAVMLLISSVSFVSAFDALKALPGAVTPLTKQEMAVTKGKALSPQLVLFFQQATSTVLAPGITVWTWSSDSNPFTVTATWNTGTLSGTATVNHP